eukprot:g5967.t1
METGLFNGPAAADHLVLCSQEGFLTQPFLSNNYSADSSSTQFTGGLGSVPNYGQSSYAFISGQPQQPFRRPELTLDAETLGYLDEASGMYITPQVQSPGTFTDCSVPNRGVLPSFKTTAVSYSPYAETHGSSSGSNGLSRDSTMFIPNMCPETSVDLSPWGRMTPARFNLENAMGNKLKLSDFNQSMMTRARVPVSTVLPSLGEQTMTLDQQTMRNKTGMLEPTLTSASNWRNPVNINPSIKEENQSTKEVQSPRSVDCSCGSSKARWKPNNKQLCFLEQHFRTGIVIFQTLSPNRPPECLCFLGFSKTTPELFRAVHEAGPVTESQVSVWLKNRLARCNRYPGKESDPKSEESSCFDAAEHQSTKMTGNKRERQEDDLTDDFYSVQSAVLNELSGILQSVDSRDAKGLARAIRDANRVCCYGVNREGLEMKGFALSLFYLGFKAHYVGDTTAPPLAKGDLFLVSAGPSYYSTVSALALEAMRSGARVIAFTAHKTAPLPFAESVIRIASQTLPPCMPVMNRKLSGVSSDVVSSLSDGMFSCMPMGDSFEVALSLLLESICVMLRKRLGIAKEDKTLQRTNRT